MSQE
jgi:hypothetical protein